MTIIKFKNSIEIYRALAKSKDINEITGRSGRPDLTNFISSEMSKNIKIKKKSIVVDIGCGDGQFLIKSLNKFKVKFKGKLFGILPTLEEVNFLKKHLKMQKKNSKLYRSFISLKVGNYKNTKLPSSFCDITVCNGVLNLAGTKKSDVINALSEFNRITKKKGKLYIGELPDVNEFQSKDYDQSILLWLYWVIKNQGISFFFKSIKQVISALITDEPFIIYPKNYLFYIKPRDFIKLVKTYGFKVQKYQKNLEIDVNGKKFFSKSRWNYIFIKES